MELCRSQAVINYSWPRQYADACIPFKNSSLVNESLIGCRTNGIYQLPYAKHYLYFLFLWIWIGLLRQASFTSDLLCSSFCMDFSADLLQYLATLFPFRAFWVGMAVVDVLEKAADEIINLFTHPAPTLSHGKLPSLLRKEGIFCSTYFNSIKILFLSYIIHHIQ